MTDNQYILTMGHINSLMRYAKHRYQILDWYVDFDMHNGMPKNIVVACDADTFNQLVRYAQCKYPNLTIEAMTVPTFMQRGEKTQ